MASDYDLITQVGTLTEDANSARIRVALRLSNSSFYLRSNLDAGVSFSEYMPMPMPAKLQVGHDNDGTAQAFFDGFIERIVFMPGADLLSQPVTN